MPPGFPKGQTAYTTAKVIAARAFPPPGATWKTRADRSTRSNPSTRTHVAGIAAGNYRTPAGGGRRRSGVAPRAYLGNYKALTVPTDSGSGLNGNAPELVAAIEAAVADGMDVINLSLGEPEIEPSRDVVAQALDAAAAAGVVPVVAAGNDYEEFGSGSATSPGSAARAITVAAADVGAKGHRPRVRSPPPGRPRCRCASSPTSRLLASESCRPCRGAGSVQLGHQHGRATCLGRGRTLLQRHPGWSVAQVKGALVATARPARAARADRADARRERIRRSRRGRRATRDRRAQQRELRGARAGSAREQVDRRLWTQAAERASGSSPSTSTVRRPGRRPGTVHPARSWHARDHRCSPAPSRAKQPGRHADPNQVVRRVPFWLRVSAPRSPGP